MKTGVVIPAYNVEAALADVLEGVCSFVPADQVVVVDDGSCDQSAGVAGTWDVNTIIHTDNRGKGAALATGFSYFLERDFDWIVTLDGDGQHLPEMLPDFIRTARTTTGDIILGQRCFTLNTMPWDRFCSNFISSLCVSLLSGTSIRDSQCGYRIISCNLLKNIDLETRHYEAETELLIKAVWAGWKVGFCEIPVVYNDSNSSINRIRDMYRFCRLCVSLLCKWR